MGEPVGIWLHDSGITAKARPQKAVVGILKGKTQVLEPEWWKPKSENQVDTFVEGRD